MNAWTQPFEAAYVAGIGDQDVELAERLDRQIHRAARAHFSGNVRLTSDRIAAELSDLPTLPVNSW